MRNVMTIFKRELMSYFSTPVAYVFIVIFLALMGALAFYVGGFFTSGQATLLTCKKECDKNICHPLL